MAPRKRGLVQVKLRITDDLKRRLDKEASKRVDGSLSAEIAERLERSFSAPALEKGVATAVANELPALVATAVMNELKIVTWDLPTVGEKKGGGKR
jgi:hypothetical protein